MKKILSLLVLASLLFISCKKETTESAPTEEVAVADTKAVATDTAAPTTVVTETPQQLQPVATGSVMSSQPGATAKSYTATSAPPPPPPTAKGMNPAHGQPGHRCDISVGAPLNSPAGKKAAPATVTKASTVTPQMVQTANNNLPATVAAPTEPVVTAPGMNPPHGQPGHVCGTPVGAPLPKN